VIRQINEETGTSIDIENDGTVRSRRYKVPRPRGAASHRTHHGRYQVAAVYEGKVARLMDFGAFVTILPGRDGLVPHLADFPEERSSVSATTQGGDVVRVKVLEVDRQGRVRLSMRTSTPPSGPAAGLPVPAGLRESALVDDEPSLTEVVASRAGDSDL